MSTLLIKNIGRLQTPLGKSPAKGSAQGENLKLDNASVFIEDGIIREVVSGELHKDADTVIDAEGNLVTPGLVDGHTHLVFGGYRQHEIPLKLKGASYLEILKAGGGILDTVEQTRATEEEALYRKAEGFLDEMMAMGVTTCEAKSGYGLDLENEEKMLRVIDRLRREHPMDLVATFMGAHAVPPEYKEAPQAYLDLLCQTMLPAIGEKGLATFVDIFCEDGVFGVEDSKRYLNAARNLGFGLKIHTDEIEELGGSVLAGEMGVASAEHLIAIGPKGLSALAEGGVTAMCLPATSFYLNKNYAPAREMIRMGIPVATGSDFNPGSCPSLNLQFVMNLAYLNYRMTPEEILTAVTLNPACAIGQGSVVGSLEPGKKGDLVIWNAPDMEMLCYRFGSNLALQTIKEGRLV